VLDATWKSAVAAVIDAKGLIRGTAFFIGDDVALTCDHVLAAAGDGSVFLRRVGSDEIEEVLARDADGDLDLALVRVAPKSGSPWLALEVGEPRVGQEVTSHGFPIDHPVNSYPNGFPTAAAVTDGTTDLKWGERVVVQLILTGSHLAQGFSGAPAVDLGTGAVAGVLTKLENNGERAYAVPATVVRLRWPLLPVDASGEGARYAGLTSAIDDVLPAAWRAFDPARLHCVVVASEGDTNQELNAVLAEVLVDERAVDLWQAFAQAAEGRRLLGGEVRTLTADYTPAQVRHASFSVVDAFASVDSLSTATRLLVQADLVLFDVTGFEPAVMLLMGIRGATRRGVTIASHGARWQEGQPLRRPFNLSDLSLSSHAASTETRAGDDPRIARLSARIRLGFEQYTRHPHYLDLPVYDALRRLGSQETAWASIPLEEEVLVLCSYDERYSDTWEKLRRHTREALRAANMRPKVARLQDTATPQLVSQTLYERVRRCAACIADWTYASPSTFLELGVRLVASPSGVVQIAEKGWLQRPVDPTGEGVPASVQVQRLQVLFDPLTYDKEPDAATGKDVASLLVDVRQQVGERRGHPVRRAATEALSGIEERLPDPARVLRDEADGLNHVGRTRTNVPQALFYEAPKIKADEEGAALERRLAAWLYLEHRVHAGDLADGDPRKALWRELGETVAGDLYQTGEDADINLAERIEEKLA
jgi:hypothetical protein